ncbi:MAG: hypothetical protein MI923_29530 [Phycisphaerales bacterium]|nr:hypothetical protein [Phycisphaerales bacterium]
MSEDLEGSSAAETSSKEDDLQKAASTWKSQLRTAGCFCLMVVAVHLVASPNVQLSQWHVSKENQALLEARAWLDGRLDVDAWRDGRTASSSRIHDTALYADKLYNVYPPMFTFLSVVALAAGNVMGVPAGEFYPPWYVGLIALPLPFIGFWAFLQIVRRAEWAAVLTAYWLLGTPMQPMLNGCSFGSINCIHHVLATAGLLLIVGDLMGRKRIWPAAIGLLIAAWSRQLTILYGLAIVWVAWRSTECGRRKVVLAFGSLTLAAGTLMFLSWQKFDSPFESGYRYLYEGREESWYGRRAISHGLFSLHFLSENAWYMNLSPPKFRFSPAYLQQDNDTLGVSIWMTSPVLLAGFLGIRRWRRNSVAGVLMAVSLVVIFMLLTYHNPGSPQVGYFRFALDFLPVWMGVTALWVTSGWRRHATLACLAWSALYFHMLF